MRILSYIFSFYMLVLAFYPCLDIEPLTQDSSQFIATNDNQSVDVTPIEGNHEHADGHCSPFCMCHCCHTHFVIKDLPLVSSFPTQDSLIGFHSKLRKDEWIRPFLRPPIYA